MLHRPATLTGMLLLLASSNVCTAQMESWTSQPADTSLEFIGHYENTELRGEFSDFTVRLVREANALPIALEVHIGVDSADMDDADLNEEIQQEDWFYSSRFPQASYISRTIRTTGTNRFVASGTLSLKGMEKEVEVPFNWSQDSAGAQIIGTLELARGNWNIGSGEWANDETIADRVTVHFSVRLLRSE